MLTRSAIRAFSTQALKVINDVAKQQFSITVKDDKAALEYELSGKNITFTETNVPEVFQGKGIGKILAKYAFDYAAEKDLTVICQCSFLSKYYSKNKHLYPKLKFVDDVNEE